jgi:hypothetical protein
MFHPLLNLSSYVFLLLVFCPCNFKAKNVTCTDASENLYDSKALETAFENLEGYADVNCNTTTVNEFCYWSYVTGEENIWSLVLKYNGAPQTNLTQVYKSACQKAGGRVVEVTFDLEITGLNPWYFNETGVVSKYSLSASPECVSASACKTTSDIEEYIKYGWATYYNATVRNLNVYQLQWGNASNLF